MQYFLLLANRIQRETLDSDVQTHRNNNSFNDNLLGIFQVGKHILMHVYIYNKVV